MAKIRYSKLAKQDLEQVGDYIIRYFKYRNDTNADSDGKTKK